MFALDPVIIRVSDLKDEILFPSSRHCSSFKRLLAQMEVSYLFTSEFIDLVEEFQKHSGLNITIHTYIFYYFTFIFDCTAIMNEIVIARKY